MTPILINLFNTKGDLIKQKTLQQKEPNPVIDTYKWNFDKELPIILLKNSADSTETVVDLNE